MIFGFVVDDWAVVVTEDFLEIEIPVVFGIWVEFGSVVVFWLVLETLPICVNTFGDIGSFDVI